MEIQRAAHTAWRRLGDEVVVIDLGTSMVYGLDDRGGRVWESIGEGCGMASLAEALAEEAARGDALHAVARFLAELADAGLLAARPSGAAFDGETRAGTSTDPRAPRILWREKVQRFGGTCGLRPSQGTPCNGKPTWS
jgi:hypothetical protein